MMRALAPSLLLMAAVVTWGGCDDDAPPPSDGGAQVADRGRRGGETDAVTDSTGADQPVRDGDVEREFPVDENDPRLRSIVESARQLGLKVEEE